NIIHYGVNSHENPACWNHGALLEEGGDALAKGIGRRTTDRSFPSAIDRKSRRSPARPTPRRFRWLQCVASHAIFLPRPPCAADDLDYYKPKMNVIQYGIEHERIGDDFSPISEEAGRTSRWPENSLNSS